MPSLAASLVGLALITQAAAHLSLINIYGANNAVGHAFGVNLQGKYPRARGEDGDAGGDSGIFQTGTDTPSPACGSTPELGEVDVTAWLSQAEGEGLPSAYANMSVVVEAFQVNRDGGGPMSCEYSDDANATSWKPMSMTLNQAGTAGIYNQVRTNETVVMNFPSDAQCTGGWTQTACIVRCRTGVNKRFGGCFAVKLNGATERTMRVSDSNATSDTSTVVRAVANATALTTDLSNDQMVLLANQVITKIKQEDLVFSSASANNTASSLASSSTTNSSTLDESDLVDNEQMGLFANQVIIQMKKEGIVLSSASANNTASNLAQAATNNQLDTNNSTTDDSTLDNSDLADSQLYNNSAQTSDSDSSTSNTRRFVKRSRPTWKK
ncbi:hypothetical protein PCANC_05697 [Puccinia coronata f. sp. avenae]|uniref:Uncharacterized protein n=1 Tax=Puccinia coronata f. sp. avenae TaxID=200324 RepID=A0A2N5VXZ4_9BASI|nr:hypothetical protein PCASD_09051 [Puccinia coronata f. sp. avenae]PLW54858.1 hypothetical protein PCANC_05697 [Puccinia coronata f. sp. avenae]